MKERRVGMKNNIVILSTILIMSALIMTPLSVAVKNGYENPAEGQAGIQSVSVQGNPLEQLGESNLQSDQSVSYDHTSVIDVKETITPLGGGQWRYSYEFTNTDTSGIWHFGVWLPFTIVPGSSTLFTQKPGWGTDNGVPIGSVVPSYDARNLDPNIVLAKNVWGPGWKSTTDPISVGQYVSGYSFIATVYDPSPKYYFYEFVNSYAAETGIITAVGRTGVGGTNMVFVRGGNNALWYRGFDGTSWGPWTSLNGVIASDPDATKLNNNVYAFVRGGNNKLYYKKYDGTSWGGWVNLGGYLTSAPGVSTWNNKIYVFVRGGNNKLYYNTYDGASWSGWTNLGGGLTSGPGAS